MTDHVRRQIRDQIVTTLTGLTTTGSRVHKNRPDGYQLEESGLPALIVRTPVEQRDPELDADGGNSTTQFRTLIATIVALAQTTTDVDDVIDTIAKEVEIAFGADHTLGGLAKDLSFEAFRLEVSGEGDQPIARGEIDFSILYSVEADDPTVAA